MLWSAVLSSRAAFVISWLCGSTSGQGANQFGVQDRARATQQMIVIAVQQAISSLPPTSAQSFVYRFNTADDTYEVDTLLGPTVLRSAQAIGTGKLSLRAAVSYFELDETLGPISYEVVGTTRCTGFGVRATSKVGILNLSANYGLTGRLELAFNLPLVLSDTEAFQTFLARNPGSGRVTETDCNDLSGLSVDQIPFAGITLPGGQPIDFDDGTNAGVGRISIAAKGVLYASQSVDVAFFPEFYFPSPNEAQFAGSSSAAILPRLVAQAAVSPVRLYADVGYEWDFDNAELRRFAWDVGVSLPLHEPRSTFDVGLGGSLFEEGVQWTPETAPILNANGQTVDTIHALEPTRLGNNFVDFLFGAKIAVTERIVLSGAVSVPVNDDGVRPAAVGTLAVEFALL